MQDDFANNLINEVDVMVQYASGQGKTPPPEVIAPLYQLQQKFTLPVNEEQVGVFTFTSEDLASLSAIHKTMTALILPAKPKSIVLMES